MPNIPPALSHTPWGATQHHRERFPGIHFVSTAGHGGVWLSPERRQAMPEPLRHVGTWAGLPWYEEDCDWALVALAFPEDFDGYSLHHAIGTARSFHKDKFDVEAYLTAHPTGRTAATKARDWFHEHKKQWEFGVECGGPEGCTGCLTTIDRTESYSYRCENWPSLPQPFTLEQLRAAVPGIVLYDSITRTPAPAAA